MKEIIKKLRLEIKRLSAMEVENKTSLRKQIQELTWKPGSEEIVAKLRAERDENGRRKYGKKALKPYRRPETGPERTSLHMSKGYWQVDTRYCLLAYGMLRGRAYKQIEQKTKNPVYAYSLHQTLVSYGSTLTKQNVQDWLDGKFIVEREKV